MTSGTFLFYIFNTRLLKCSCYSETDELNQCSALCWKSNQLVAIIYILRHSDVLFSVKIYLSNE